MSCALHDYCCQRCGYIQRDVAVEISVGARGVYLICPLCDPPAGMDWIPQIGRMSAAHGPTFTPFECYDGRNQKVRVESIADLRRIEKESEQHARNGEGQIMVWRDFSNDRSNKDQAAISKDWTAPGLEPRASDWHDHPEFTPVPTISRDDIAHASAEPGADNETVKHL